MKGFHFLGYYLKRCYFLNYMNCVFGTQFDSVWEAIFCTSLQVVIAIFAPEPLKNGLSFSYTPM